MTIISITIIAIITDLLPYFFYTFYLTICLEPRKWLFIALLI